MDETLSRVLAAWVDAVRRRAGAVVVAVLLATAPLLWYAATHLGVNADNTSMLSEDLPFRQLYDQFARVFPILDNALLVVVDAESSLDAHRAADALADKLTRQPETFESAYVPWGGEFFEANALLYLSTEQLENLADHLAAIQPLIGELSRDSTLRGLCRVLTQGIERMPPDASATPTWKEALDRVQRAAKAVFTKRAPRGLSWESLFVSGTFPGEPRRRVVILQPVLDLGSLLPARSAILAVREAAQQLGLDESNGIRVRVTGNVALNYEEMLVIARQAVLVTGVSFVLVGVLLAFGLGSARFVFCILGTLLVGLGWTAAFAAWAIGSLNMISIAFGVLFVGLGVDFGIHLCMRYRELLSRGWSGDAALRETAGGVGGSLVLCTLTTAVGFYVFVPTDFIGVAELGLISGTGMFISLFTSLTFLPALLSLGSPVEVRSVRSVPPRIVRAATAFPRLHARRIRFGATVLAVAATALASAARFDHNLVRLRDPSTESAQAFDDLLSASTTSPWNIDVLVADLAAAEAMAPRLRALPLVETAITLHNFVPEDQEEKLAILEDVAMFMPLEFPADAALPPPTAEEQLAAVRELHAALDRPWLREANSELGASAVLLRSELGRFLERAAREGSDTAAIASLERMLLGSFRAQLDRLRTALDPDPVDLEMLPRDVVRQMLAEDGRARIQVFPAEDLNVDGALDRFVDQVRTLAPAATGSAVSLVEWADAVVRSFQQALGYGVLLIGALLLLRWRRLSDMTLVLAPLGLAAVLTVATSVLINVPFNFINVIVLPLLLGIGVDSGIHLVHRYRSVSGADDDLLRTSTARAVCYSALTTVGSFGCLAISTHPGLSSLGLLLTIGVGWVLVCNLIVLPALIEARAEPRHASARAQPSPAG